MQENHSLVSFQPPDWRHSAFAGFALAAAYAILVAVPPAFAFIFGSGGVSTIRGFALHLALMAFAILNLQFVLSARFKFIDRPFGLDAVMVFHKTMAVVAFYLVLAHPVLLVLDMKSLYLFSFQTSWVIYFGKGALLILLGVVLASLLLRPLRMNYQVWRFGHRFVVVVVALAAIHSFYIGTDLGHPALWFYWIFLLALSGGTFVYRNLVVPTLLQRRFVVKAVEPVTHDTWNITYEVADGKPFRYQPGQFMFVKHLRDNAPREQHHFTISSSPTQDVITQTIKESGDYTSTIGQTKPGTPARVEGPYGRFSLVHHRAEKFVFIAGGIGITPILSMLRYLRDTDDQRPRLLIYGNKTAGDIVFRDELESMPNLEVVHVLSQAGDDWDGPRGFVTKEIIQKHAGDLLPDAHIYVCGPQPMMLSVLDGLGSLGVKQNRIHHERFVL